MMPNLSNVGGNSRERKSPMFGMPLSSLSGLNPAPTPAQTRTTAMITQSVAPRAVGRLNGRERRSRSASVSGGAALAGVVLAAGEPGAAVAAAPASGLPQFSRSSVSVP